MNDFGVVLRDTGEGGQHIFFARPDGMPLAHFPAWDHADRDLRHFVAADVPIGSIDAPYEDADEGWRITIFEHEGFVYVQENETRFRVPRDSYLQAWAFVIDAFNPIMPLGSDL